MSPEDLPAKVRAESGNGERFEEMFVDLPSLEELEKRYLAHVLRITRDNKTMTSRILGIDRKTLYRMESKINVLLLSSVQAVVFVVS